MVLSPVTAPRTSAETETEATLRSEITRLNKVVQALMNRAERSTSVQGSDFSLFQTAVMLEDQIRARTAELEAVLRENERVNQQLQREIQERRTAQAELEKEKEEQRILIARLEEAQNQLLQSEKLASIGQLAAGIAHEINNPIGFVNSNLSTLSRYTHDLLRLVAAYEADEPAADGTPRDNRAEIRAIRDDIDLEFLRDDLPALIAESAEGATRVRQIVQDLRDFSRTGSTTFEPADLHAGIESTLNVATNELKYKADVVRDYGTLPLVECVAAQINQVFLNLLVNAAQAMTSRGTITIRSGRSGDQVWVSIADDGPGIPDDVLPRIFDPFFTTKPVGRGTGLGLSLSYGIVQRHGGRIEVVSQTGKGATFTMFLPLHQHERGDAPSG